MRSPSRVETRTETQTPAVVEGEHPLGTRWETVCRLDQLQPGRGVAALLDGRQVALFRRVDPSGADLVHAIDNVDPCSGAAVLSRGIVGDRQGEPVVASPLYKQAFSLLTGQCLDQPGHQVEVHNVRMTEGWIQVEVPDQATTGNSPDL
jgi:nitrite reductase (NADH) small subunit